MQRLSLRHAAGFAAIVSAIVIMVGCTAVDAFRKLSVTSYSIESVFPEGLRSARIGLRLGIDNPSAEIELRNMTATLHQGTNKMLILDLQELNLEKESSKEYTVYVTARIGDNIDVFSIIEFITGHLRDGDFLSGLTVDLAGDVKVGIGAPQRINLKSLPLDDIVRIASKTNFINL